MFHQYHSCPHHSDHSPLIFDSDGKSHRKSDVHLLSSTFLMVESLLDDARSLIGHKPTLDTSCQLPSSSLQNDQLSTSLSDL